MSNLAIVAPMPFAIAVPKVSFTCMSTTVLGAAPAMAKTSFWSANASLTIIGAVGKFRENELVPLLGNGGRRGYIDDERNTLLFRDLGNRGRMAGIEGANQELRTFA